MISQNGKYPQAYCRNPLPACCYSCHGMTPSVITAHAGRTPKRVVDPEECARTDKSSVKEGVKRRKPTALALWCLSIAIAISFLFQSITTITAVMEHPKPFDDPPVIEALRSFDNLGIASQQRKIRFPFQKTGVRTKHHALQRGKKQRETKDARLSSPINHPSSDEIKILLPPDDVQWMKQRVHKYKSWHEQNLLNETMVRSLDLRFDWEHYRIGTEKPGGRPWLDFFISGMPKCGTTTVQANLASIAPMANRDFCKSLPSTLQHAYEKWPQSENPTGNRTLTFQNETIALPFKGTKCPSRMQSSYLLQLGKTFPQTKLIVGIRHPIKWFESFWRMQGREDPYERMGICPCPPVFRQKQAEIFTRVCPDPYPNEAAMLENTTNTTLQKRVICTSECGDKLFCLARARFHIALARLGKTPLSDDELQWLAPTDADGGENVREIAARSPVPNRVFLYEKNQLDGDPQFWNGLGKYLGVSHIPNKVYKGSKGKRLSENEICDPFYDYFRAELMKTSYDLAMWLQRYFLPLARDPNRTDVIVANDNVDLIEKHVETYKLDPCNRLVRDSESGLYALDPTILKNQITMSLSIPTKFQNQSKYAFYRRDSMGRKIGKAQTS